MNGNSAPLLHNWERWKDYMFLPKVTISVFKIKRVRMRTHLLFSVWWSSYTHLDTTIGFPFTG